PNTSPPLSLHGALPIWLRVGLPYVPPPPYAKLDPRTADAAVLREALAGARLAQGGRRGDGVGPLLGAALARAVGEALSGQPAAQDRKSTRLNSSHGKTS